MCHAEGFPGKRGETRPVLKRALAKLLDPAGPLGEVLSPAVVYKERQGVPVTQKVELRAPAHLEAALAPVRFVALTDAVDVPASRVRQVSAFVEEHWSPVYQKTDSRDMVEILRASQTQVGWEVRQRPAASTRARKYETAEQFVEIAQSAQIQATDEFYVGYYETIPGNDPIEIDGKVVTGGTRIGSRTAYNAATKGFVHWDAGFWEQKKRAEAEMASRPVRNVAANLDRVAGACLPMRRLLPNPRVDRTRAV
jgi:hypothetical protein